MFSNAFFFTQHPAGFVFVRWVVDGAAAHDAAPALRLPVAAGSSSEEVQGLQGVLDAVHVKPELQQLIKAQLAELGVIHCSELRPTAWESLEVWASPRELEKR